MISPKPSTLKLFNDPVHGFITAKDKFILNLIDHPYLQRLRRISQLGVAHLVYPGALHTRFHHTLGAMHLMQMALDVIIAKGNDISSDDYRAAMLAILLHDVGHGPLSHNLEHAFLPNLSHEDISVLFIKKLNKQYGGELDRALMVFENKTELPFLHQLVSGQLDTDRLDYIKRDSFFTGVSEGQISTERIVKMMNISDNNLVIELKGIYSIEKFIVARRLMYWQVYYHKTVLAAQTMIYNIFSRARFLLSQNYSIDAPSNLLFFLKNNFSFDEVQGNDDILNKFALLDDNDVYQALKIWSTCNDYVLKELSTGLLNRRLFRVEIFGDSETETANERIRNIKQKISMISDDVIGYFCGINKISNSAYKLDETGIPIIDKKGKVSDMSELSDMLNIPIYNHTVTKSYLYYPKWLVD